MIVAELIAELSKLDQSAVVCTKYDNTDPFEIDNRGRVVDGLNWGKYGTFATLTDGRVVDLEDGGIDDLDWNPEANFAVVLLG